METERILFYPTHGSSDKMEVAGNVARGPTDSYHPKQFSQFLQMQVDPPCQMLCTTDEGPQIEILASHARGPWFKPQRLHSSFLLKPSNFVPVSALLWNEAGEN